MVSSGMSAHCPVKRVTGRAIVRMLRVASPGVGDRVDRMIGWKDATIRGDEGKVNDLTVDAGPAIIP
jgi:hypothetical protein